MRTRVRPRSKSPYIGFQNVSFRNPATPLPVELVDAQTDCGHEWTALSSRPVRRTLLLISSCFFLLGTSLLSILLFIPWQAPSAHIASIVFWIGWVLITSIFFVTSLRQWLAKEPILSLSRPRIRNGQAIALRWQLPDGMQDGEIRIELSGQEEWVQTVYEDVHSNICRFLTLILLKLPEGGPCEGTIYFRASFSKPSTKEKQHKIRYWISFQHSRAIVLDYEYKVTVEV